MQNILAFSSQCNWVDILIFVVFLRIAFISLKQGLGVETFKLSGTFLALYLSLHYYFSLASYLSVRSGSRNPPDQLLQVASFFILFYLGYAFLWSLRFLTFKFITAEINPNLSKWGGFAVGLVRAYLLSSLILIAFLILRLPYLKDSVNYSFFGRPVSQGAVSVYTWTWDSLVSKLVSGEKYNPEIKKLYQTEPEQKKKDKK